MPKGENALEAGGHTGFERVLAPSEGKDLRAAVIGNEK